MAGRPTRTKIKYHGRKAVEAVEDALGHLSEMKRIRDESLGEHRMQRDDMLTDNIPEFTVALDTCKEMIKEWEKRL